MGNMKAGTSLVLLMVLVPMTLGHPLVPDMTASPLAVFVDDDYTSSMSGWGVDHFSDMQEAIDAVGDHGVVHIASGHYSVDGHPISIDGKVLSITGEKGCIITGDGVHDVFRVSGSQVTIGGCTIQGGRNGVLSVGSILELEGNAIMGNGLNGVAMVNFTFAQGGLLASNNIVVGNGGDGIVTCSLFLSSTSLDLVNNVISDNGSNGIEAISIPNSHSDGVLANNIVTGNLGFGASLPGDLEEIAFNDVWGNAAGNYRGIDHTGAAGNISDDPMFSGASYHLSYDSPCVDSGAEAEVYGGTGHDIEGMERPLGRGCDMGAYETAVITILQLSDLHLLAPVDGELAYGEGYDTYIWSGFEDLMERISEEQGSLGIDIVVVSGDIVNWATDSTTYNTILGETYVVTEWERTFEGYLLFKERLRGILGDVPIIETVGNHDYREHPYQFWTWNDKTGIDAGFLSSTNYADYSCIEVSEILGLPLSEEVVIHLMNSGCDRIGLDVRDRVLLPYLAANAANYDELLAELGSAAPPSSLEGFLEDLAYGSGFDDGQMEDLSLALAAHGDDINLIFAHHPVVYPKITITENIEEFLDLCRSYGVPLVSGGHTHQTQGMAVDWEGGGTTIFETVGSAIDGHFGLITVQVGSVEEGGQVTLRPL